MDATSGIPYYLEKQLKDTLAALIKAVRERGLEATMAYELWELQEQAKEAETERDFAKAKRFVAGRHEFLAKINAPR